MNYINRDLESKILSLSNTRPCLKNRNFYAKSTKQK